MPGALSPTLNRSLVPSGPLPSMGTPSASTTRPSSSMPTGTSTMAPVRLTTSPSLMSLSLPKTTTPTLSGSKLSAMPFRPELNSTISSAWCHRKILVMAYYRCTELKVRIGTVIFYPWNVPTKSLNKNLELKVTKTQTIVSHSYMKNEDTETRRNSVKSEGRGFTNNFNNCLRKRHVRNASVSYQSMTSKHWGLCWLLSGILGWAGSTKPNLNNRVFFLLPFRHEFLFIYQWSDHYSSHPEKYEKTDAPFDLFKEKKFSSLGRDNELFWELKKVKNGRNRSKFRKTVFYKQSLDFQCPSKILCHTSNLWNFVKITGPYCTTWILIVASSENN